MSEKDDIQAATIRFPRDLHERLRRLAFEQRTSMNDIVIAAVTTYLPTIDPNATVHHRDGNPRNNNPDNLEIRSKP